MRSVTAISEKRRNRQGGSAFVEFAIVSLIMIPIFFAVIDYSRIFYYGSIAQGAARAGTQYAAYQAPNHSNTTAVQNAATADATNVPSSQSFTATATYWCQCSDQPVTSTTSCTSTCTSPATMYVYSQVNTQLTFSTFFKYPLLPSSVTVKGQSIMRVQ
jgi:Flp pilus assembly protein TadG